MNNAQKTKKKVDSSKKTTLTLGVSATEPGNDPETGLAKYKVYLSGELILSGKDSYKEFLDRLNEDHTLEVEL